MFSPDAPSPSFVETPTTTGHPTRKRLFAASVTGVSEMPAASRASVAPVHHRMPLVLRAQEVRPWLEDEQTARRLLHETPPELERRETDGQLRLW